MKKIIITAFISICFSNVNFAQIDYHENQYAPKDAYLKGSEFAYYGSLNPWDRRFFTKESADQLINRWGQRYFLDILESRTTRAVNACNERLKTNPDDLEARFILAAAECKLNKPKKAFEEMMKAINAGLSFSRFLAGPRDIFKPLYKTNEFKKYYSEHPVELIHGPMLGNVTGNSAEFWVRTWSEISVEIIVYDSEANGVKQVSSGVNKTSAEDGYTAIINVGNLKPRIKYFYNVFINNRPYYKNGLPHFFTYPEKGGKGKFKITFGGGAGFNPQSERVWSLMNSYGLSACLLLGDNVYIDMPGFPGPFHDYTYFRRQSRAEFRQLTSETPIYSVWDDHDVAIDDIWMGPYIDKPLWKQANFDYYKQQWVNPYYGDKKYPGSWFDFSMGDLDFIMLEGRMYRTNPYDKNPSMLGTVQKEWLFHKLKNSTATIKVLVSPVGWAPGIKEGSMDTWDGFPDEREEIFSFIEKNKIDGVILLSADRHRSDAWKISRTGGYPLYEFMSSKLTNVHTHEINPKALFSYNNKCSFGLIEFDTTLTDPEITYTIVSIDNEHVYSLKIKKSEISY